MSTGTTHMNGLMAGAARLGSCAPAHRLVTRTAAPLAIWANAEHTWLDARSYVQVSPKFGMTRPDPRPPERSP